MLVTYTEQNHVLYEYTYTQYISTVTYRTKYTLYVCTVQYMQTVYCTVLYFPPNRIQ